MLEWGSPQGGVDSSRFLPSDLWDPGIVLTPNLFTGYQPYLGLIDTRGVFSRAMASSNISSEEFGAPSSGIPTSPETVTSGSSGVIHSAMPVVPYLDTSGTSIAESAPGGYASSSTSPSTLGRAGSSRRAHSRRRYRTGGAYRSGTALVQGDAPVNIAEGMTQGSNLGTSLNL